MQAKITIITINLNNSAGLEQTIQSVISQPFQSIEYIVIDGDSKDESKEILKKYSDNVHTIISEKDTGIYNAMNKGIAHANGEYLLFLNSGDTLMSGNPLEQLVKEGNNADIIYGNIKTTEGNKFKEVVFPSVLSFKFFYINSLPHPCTLIRKMLFDKIGLYREDFKIASDWAFFTLAICKYNCSYKHVNITVANFMLGGLSSTHLGQISMEREQLLKEHFPAFANDYKELYEMADALNEAKKQFGYRAYRKFKNLFVHN